MTLRLLPLAVLLLAGCASAPPQGETAMDFATARRLAQAQAPAAVEAYGIAWAGSNNERQLDERDGCYFKAPGPTTQVLVIDATGTVTGYFAEPENARSACWRGTYLGEHFPAPPFAPYYHVLEMN